MNPFLLLIIGLVALVGGAELLVKYGSQLAERLHVSPLVIGLTIVSIGTSMPEIAVGIDAMRRGAGSMVLGNIVGTNMHILFILGLAAVIRPIILGRSVIRFDLPVMLLSAALLLAVSIDGYLTTIDGIILLLAAAAYLFVVLRNAKAERHANPPVETDEDEDPEAAAATIDREPRWYILRDLVLLLAGLAIIIFGADWMVGGAVAIAEQFGISETVIGLTIVAIGTSLPELATMISATIRGRRAIAVGNLLGSSVLNATLILGAALMFGEHYLALDPVMIRIDLPIMAGVFLLCIPIFRTGHRISRIEGAIMVALYLVYLGFLLWTALS